MSEPKDEDDGCGGCLGFVLSIFLILVLSYATVRRFERDEHAIREIQKHLEDSGAVLEHKLAKTIE